MEGEVRALIGDRWNKPCMRISHGSGKEGEVGSMTPLQAPFRYEWAGWCFEVMDMDGRWVDEVLAMSRHPSHMNL